MRLFCWNGNCLPANVETHYFPFPWLLRSSWMWSVCVSTCASAACEGVWPMSVQVSVWCVCMQQNRHPLIWSPAAPAALLSICLVHSQLLPPPLSPLSGVVPAGANFCAHRLLPWHSASLPAIRGSLAFPPGGPVQPPSSALDAWCPSHRLLPSLGPAVLLSLVGTETLLRAHSCSLRRKTYGIKPCAPHRLVFLLFQIPLLFSHQGLLRRRQKSWVSEFSYAHTHTETYFTRIHWAPSSTSALWLSLTYLPGPFFIDCSLRMPLILPWCCYHQPLKTLRHVCGCLILNSKEGSIFPPYGVFILQEIWAL